MAFSMCAILGLLFSFVALGLNTLSISTPHWLHTRTVYPTYNIGIFRHCEVEENFCGDMERINSVIKQSDIAWFRVIQATFILSVIGSLLGAVMTVFLLTKFFDSSKGGYKMVSVIQLLTLTSEVVAITLFGLDSADMFGFDGHTVFLSWSFYTAIGACVFLFMGVVAHTMEATRAVEVIKNVQHRITGLTSNYTLFVDQEP